MHTKTIFVALLLLTLSAFAMAATLSVALDGSEAYTCIQDAIDVAKNGDLVLVYPGIYYENLLITGKDITLASLEYSTGDLTYKRSTIIDGSQNGSVIVIRYGVSNAVVRGFTIQNGSGRYSEESQASTGGALYIIPFITRNSVNITNCIIRDNTATSHGGGIYASSCNLHLSGVSIFNNDAALGGGLYHGTNVWQDYVLTFDPDNRSSIYSNRAANGADILLSNHVSVHVVVDTFTVANPWNFYANNTYHYSAGNPNPFTFDILNTVHEEINADHYVAPWGNDANDGLSPSSPLKTIYKACYNIASDEENPKTVHIANGYYSKTANGQFFPISVKSHCKLIGESKEGVVWDLEGAFFCLGLGRSSENIYIGNLDLRNLGLGFGIYMSKNVTLDNVDLSNIRSEAYFDVFTLNLVQNVLLKNITIKDVRDSNYKGARIIDANMKDGYFDMQNVEISDIYINGPNVLVPIFGQNASRVNIDGLVIRDAVSNSYESYNTLIKVALLQDKPDHSMRIEIKNSAFYDNYQAKHKPMTYFRAFNDTTFVTNCTFAGNSGGSSALLATRKIILNNNVFWNPELSQEIILGYYPEDGITTNAEFDNNCIRGGFSGIYNMSPINQITWHDNNVDWDPLFEGEGSHPYRISAFSPLIDIGKEYDWQEDALDAGGNERVWDGDGDGVARIDLGAYEYQPVYAPAELIATVNEANIDLAWQMPDLERGLVGYRIYRNEEILINIYEPGQMQYTDTVPGNGVYAYYVVAMYGLVESAPTNTLVIRILGVANDDPLGALVPARLRVAPNPFTDLAVITYELDKNSEIELNIYNLRGQKVRQLQKGSFSKGEQILAWDGGDDAGRHTSAGVYFIQLKQDGKMIEMRKLLKY